ncbi:protein translocase subunit SecF [Candidatus Gottesmanbacteria bacterium]|nr:protein translocase subunit SecF [Candidatus Gottesmanbacteria bacterium]
MLPFMKYKWLYAIISSLVLVSGIFSLVVWSLEPSIDFSGGTLLELKFKQDTKILIYGDIRSILEEKGLEVSSVQSSGEGLVLIRMKPITTNEVATIKAILAEKFEEMPEETRFETVGPILGQELLQKTFVAAILAVFGILAYVAHAFKNLRYGVSAVLALLHDLLVVTGIFSLLGHFRGVEVDALFVTAVLTTMSFSVHDTIVVFDRIRETLRKNPGVDFESLTNHAITETMGRSLNNSLTIVFMLLALLLLGGQTIKWFIFALLIGTISGTYSSPFVATPILVIWNKIEEKRKK